MAPTPSRFFIYALAEPRTGVIRYVGKSSGGLKVARRHTMPCLLLKDTSDKGTWLRALVASGETPTVLVLEEVEAGGAILCEAEKRWIATHRGLGTPLTNMMAGGVGATPGYAPKEATRHKQSERARERHATQEGKEHVRRMVERRREAFAWRRFSMKPVYAMAWLEAQHAA